MVALREEVVDPLFLDHQALEEAAEVVVEEEHPS
jgi:hypothetical protein